MVCSAPIDARKCEVDTATSEEHQTFGMFRGTCLRGLVALQATVAPRM